MRRGNVGMALAAVLTATGAWAQQFTQFGSGWAAAEGAISDGKPVRLEHVSVEYARDPRNEDEAPSVLASVYIMMLDTGTIVAGTEFALTYRLVNATFADHLAGRTRLFWGTIQVRTRSSPTTFVGAQHGDGHFLSFARFWSASPVTVLR